jgi:hypothetical protein
MPLFQTVIRRARFVYSPYTATEMQGFAQVLADSIRARIQSGQPSGGRRSPAESHRTSRPGHWNGGLRYRRSCRRRRFGDRFHDIAEDLTLIVFFAPAEGTASA